MKIYVDEEERELHVYDRVAGNVDYARHVLCAEERLTTTEYGEFSLTAAEFAVWEKRLAKLQESEDIRFAIHPVVDAAELDDYIYEDTMYCTSAAETIDMENICLKELQAALTAKDAAWLTENRFPKTLKKLMT